MQVEEQKSLFTEISSEESSVVSGGKKHGHHDDNFHFDLDAYLFGLGAGVVFGNPGLTQDETQYSWEQALTASGRDISL